MTSHSSGHYPEIQSTRTRGTVAIPTAIQSGDDLLRQNFFGHNGSTAINGASITVRATENWSGSNRGVSYTIGTEANGGTGIVDRIKIDGSGDITLGNFKFDGTQTVGAGQDDYVLTYDHSTGKISLEASAGGGSSLWSENVGNGIYFNTGGDAVSIGDTATNALSEGGKLYVKGDATITSAFKVDGSDDAEAFSVESASTKRTWMHHMEVAGSPGTPRFDVSSSAFMKLRAGRLYMYTDIAGSVNGFRALSQSGHMTLDLYNNVGTKIWQMGSNTGYPNFDNTGKDFTFGNTSSIGARVGIRGTGTTSGTSSLLCQDSGGTSTFEVLDNGTAKSTGQIGSSAGATPNTETPTGATETIDWNNGNYQILDLESASGNVTLTLSNPVVGFGYFLEIRQDSTTPLDVIFPSSVKFAGETAPYTLDVSTGANAVDAVSLAWNGSEYIASFSQNHG